MYVVIVGAGTVGSAIAESIADTHDVAVIDIDEELIEHLMYDVDVLGVTGDGTDIETLLEAGIEKADLVIASTDDDETNLIVCGTVRTVGDAFTIARVKSVQYRKTWEQSAGAFGVDHMVATNLLTAENIARIVGLPSAHDVETFADGLVQMAEFEVGSESPVADQTVEAADRYESLTFAAVLRDDTIIVPRGDTVLRAGDDLIVIGSPDSIQMFGHEVAPAVENATDIVVIGGSDVGYHTARLLQEHGLSPRLVEADPDRARELAEALPGTTVLNDNATDSAFLERERIGSADVLIAALDSDEKNLLVTLLADQLGTARTVAVVNSGEYSRLFEAVGVDVAINPREATAEELTRFTREHQTEGVAIIENDRAEVLEVKVDADSVLVDRPISESVQDLPDGVVIGAITRDGAYVIPRGDTVVKHGDHVVVFVDATCLAEANTKL